MSGQDVLDAIYAEHFPNPAEPVREREPLTALEDQEVVRRCARRTGAGLEWARRHAEGFREDDDRSAVTHGYLMRLFRFTDDREQVDRIMRASALYRAK